MDAGTTPDRKSLAEAAAWRVQLADEGRETSPEHQAWLVQHPDHAAAWGEAQAMWASFDEQAALPAMLTARQEALARPGRRPAALRGRAGLAQAAAAAAIVVLLLGSWILWRAPAPTTYAGGHGPPQVLALADGSRVTLDSDSLLKVSFAPEARRLVLVRGRARFDVAHDASRPFSVRAGDRTVVATGTSFQVEHEGPAIRILLIRGRAKVVRDRAPLAFAPDAPAARLGPGEELSAREGEAAPARIEAVDLQRATAWEDGRLIFDDAPLGEVAAQVSRYTGKPVTTGDPQAAALRISGVFKAGDLATFVDTVTRYLPVTAHASADGVVLRSRNP